jgi:phosphatidate cytidylyltransferase
MTPNSKAAWMFGGVVALLALASAVGALLAHRATTERGRATIENLHARVNAWWVMVVVIAAAYALGRTATIVLFGFVSFFALREFITLTPTRPGDYLALLLAFFVLLPGQYLLIGYDQYGTFAIFVPVDSCFSRRWPRCHTTRASFSSGTPRSSGRR